MQVVHTRALRMGDRLLPGEALSSASGEHVLFLQGDGNLVGMAAADGTPCWASDTNDVVELVMQEDGNLVGYNGAGKPVFASHTVGTGVAAELQGGYLVVTAGGGRPVYAFREVLRMGDRLLPGEALSSASGEHVLLLQGDGNLVGMAAADGTPCWASNMNDVVELVMQEDGNLVGYVSAGALVFASHTVGTGVAAELQGDGNLVGMAAADGTPCWASNMNDVVELVMQGDGNLAKRVADQLEQVTNKRQRGN